MTFSQLQQLTIGAISVCQDEQSYCFSRCTPSQLDAFYSANPEWGERAMATAGVRVDFHTDARMLTVGAAAPGKYEVLVNNLTVYAEELEAFCDFFVPLDAGDKRITLVLPSHSPGKISGIDLQDGTYIRPHRYTMKIAFYGDSITQGWCSAKDSQSFAWLVSRHFDADSLNLGVGGITFLPKTVEDVGYAADVVIVALGTNLFSTRRSIQQVRDICAEYFDRIVQVYKDSKLFCITPIWRGDEHLPRPAGTLEQVRQIIAEEARKRKLIVVDGLTLVPHRVEYYADAYLHPNDLGFALYAQNLIHELDRYL